MRAWLSVAQKIEMDRPAAASSDQETAPPPLPPPFTKFRGTRYAVYEVKVSIHERISSFDG